MRNITETDLHAYTDGQLDDLRRVKVQAHLAHDPAAAESVRIWREQNEALRAPTTRY
jgi:anti-sigma factor RsiW